MTDAGNDHVPPLRPSERRHLIVMFCDVVDSTRLSRRRDVESYFSVLRAYYDACQSVVTRHGGFVAQRHGDGIYIWFGYPQPQKDDALRAVRAGLDLLVVLNRVSAGLEAGQGEPIQVRIAAHAGEVLVASVENESGPLAFGHTPNLAAKLQQSARPGTLVISSALLRLVERDVEVTRRPDAVLRDGMEVAVHEVVMASPGQGRIDAAWRTPLVGRQREVERLERLWTTTRDGPGAVMAIVGDRGLGKTRLALTFAATAAEHAATVLHCACSSLDAGTAYRTMRVLLVAAAGIERNDEPIVTAARLHDHLVAALGMDDQAAAVLATILGIPRDPAWPAPRLDPYRLAQLTAQTLVEWLRKVAALAPTVVVVDDVADADPSSLAILSSVAADPPPHLLMLVTAHSVPKLPDALATAQTQFVELAPLPDLDAEELVFVATEGAPLDPHVGERIVRQGEGVPLYLEELARAAQEADQTALPITLTGHLQARLASPRLDRELVGILAVAGHAIEEGVLTTLLGIEGPDLTARLAGLLDRDLVVHVTEAGSQYRFRHGLIAEAAYGLLLNQDRIRLHARVADAMVAWHRLGHRLDWNVVGRHLDLAGRPVESFEALLEGANDASGAGPTHEAMQGYRNALDVLEAIEDTGVRDRLEIRCRIRRGSMAVSARGFAADEAVEDFARCAQLCRQLGPRSEHLAAMSGVYSFYLSQGEVAEARRITEELRDWVDLAHDDYRADNGLGFGTLCFYEGDYSAALRYLRSAVHLFENQHLDERAEQKWLMPYDVYVLALTHLANVLWITGSPGEASEVADRAMARAATLPFPDGPFSMAYAKCFMAWTHNLGGHHGSAARFAADVLEIGQRHGFAFWESNGAVHLAIAEHGMSARDDAADVIATQTAFWELLRARVFLPYVLTAEAQMRADAGRRDLAAAGYEAARRLTETTGSLFYEAERLRLLAGTGLMSEDESRRMLIQSHELAQRQGASLFELRAALDLARRDPDGDAADALTAAIAKFAPGVGYPELNEARVVLARSVSPA
jgi:class 3 adenylate cyclase/tetratricopeptide (TPR) repeat protein